MKSLFLLLFTLYYCILNSEKVQAKEEEEPVVTLKTGKISGYVAKSSQGATFYGFRGIPYAAKSRRFKAPVGVEPWNGTRECVAEGAICPQVKLGTERYEGDEDCLFINVYTPQVANVELLPVLVSIHCGGFVLGSGNEELNGPHFLLNSPVVLVTFNYRLGILGFLSTEDEHAYGNYGMLDQVMALQWVQTNIRAFGGDPDRVTVYGVSAGAASIMHHMISPLSKGLFHRAIISSGSITNYWSWRRNPLETARSFARHMRCPNAVDGQAIVECLSAIPAQQLVTEARKIRTAAFFPCEWLPSVEAAGGPGFITQDPTQLFRQGKLVNKIPVMLGMAQHEGYSIYLVLATAVKLSGRRYFEHEFPHHLATYSPILANMTKAHRLLAQHYYQHVENLEDRRVFEKTVFTVVGDAMFSAGIAETAELLSTFQIPTHVYVYSHLSQHCFAQIVGGQCGKYPSHADELFLVFRCGNFVPSNEDDLQMSSLLNRLWTSFVYDKELMIDEELVWPTYDSQRRRYVQLRLNPTIKTGLLSDKIELWTKTLPSLLHKTVPHSDEL